MPDYRALSSRMDHRSRSSPTKSVVADGDGEEVGQFVSGEGDLHTGEVAFTGRSTTRSLRWTRSGRTWWRCPSTLFRHAPSWCCGGAWDLHLPDGLPGAALRSSNCQDLWIDLDQDAVLTGGVTDR